MRRDHEFLRRRLPTWAVSTKFCKSIAAMTGGHRPARSVVQPTGSKEEDDGTSSAYRYLSGGTIQFDRRSRLLAPHHRARGAVGTISARPNACSLTRNEQALVLAPIGKYVEGISTRKVRGNTEALYCKSCQ